MAAIQHCQREVGRNGVRLPVDKLRHQSTVQDLTSEMYGTASAESLPICQRRSKINEDKWCSILSISPLEPAITSKTAGIWSMRELRRSISDLNIAGRVKSVIGKKRAREEDDEDLELLECESPPRKVPASVSSFWQKYRDLHIYHNELETMIAATVIAHTYDEVNGLQMSREPPYMVERALAALEGQQRSASSSTCSSFNWSDHVEDIRYRMGLPPLHQLSLGGVDPEDDLSWAGDEVDDFKCFVRTASSPDWELRMSESWDADGFGSSVFSGWLVDE